MRPRWAVPGRLYPCGGGRCDFGFIYLGDDRWQRQHQSWMGENYQGPLMTWEELCELYGDCSASLERHHATDPDVPCSAAIDLAFPERLGHAHCNRREGHRKRHRAQGIPLAPGVTLLWPNGGTDAHS